MARSDHCRAARRHRDACGCRAHRGAARPRLLRDNLSDNLKPWPVIEQRLRLSAEADFAIAIYNPRSASRADGFQRALEILREAGLSERLVMFARAVSTADETIETVTLREARPEMADMRTLVIIGNSATRRVGRWVYAPRQAG